MILKELYLYPDLVEYSDEITSPFRYQSRSICNYLERELKSIKFKADGFNRICFIGISKPNANCFINTSKILEVEIKFDKNRYLSLKDDEFNPFFKEMLELGIRKCEKQFKIPADELIGGLKKFQEVGYLNEWCFKSKQIRGLGVKCSLLCKLTITNFHLNLVITKGKETIWNKEILKTEPDEIMFIPMFKDIVLDDDFIVVIDKLGDPIYRLLVNDIDV